jgi:hypothetical protein
MHQQHSRLRMSQQLMQDSSSSIQVILTMNLKHFRMHAVSIGTQALESGITTAVLCPITCSPRRCLCIVIHVQYYGFVIQLVRIICVV